MEEEGLGGGARLVTSDLHTYRNPDPVLAVLLEMLLHKAVSASEQLCYPPVWIHRLR